MGTAEEHTFRRKTAAPPLLEAVQDLGHITGQTLEDFEGQTLGEIFRQVQTEYGDDLPAYWKIWNSWNTLPDTPAEMGDL